VGRALWLGALLLLAAAAPGTAVAHPGGLDAKGCHTNRKTGEYHCHRGQAAPSSKGVVKMSSSGICHDSNSPWYSQTQKFTTFDSIEACLRAGGRLPKQ
jgi:hypothetical protein